LRTDYSEHALFFRKSGKFLRLSQAVAEGPLAVNVLARGDRRLYHIKIMRHPHGDADHIDIRRGDQCSGHQTTKNQVDVAIQECFVDRRARSKQAIVDRAV
jgi:hypothetical protein